MMKWMKVPYFDGLSQFAAWPAMNYVSIDKAVFLIDDAWIWILLIKY